MVVVFNIFCIEEQLEDRAFIIIDTLMDHIIELNLIYNAKICELKLKHKKAREAMQKMTVLIQFQNLILDLSSMSGEDEDGDE